ncbi:MAG: Flp family type IVb pilin [Vulcanimicrobiaceae bacterium]
MIVQVLKDERGESLVSYALVLALFGIITILGFYAVASAANTQLATTQTGLTNSGLNPPQ